MHRFLPSTAELMPVWRTGLALWLIGGHLLFSSLMTGQTLPLPPSVPKTIHTGNQPASNATGATHRLWSAGRGQRFQGAIVVRESKIDDEVVSLAHQRDVVPVFVMFSKHPQREIVERIRGVHSLRLQVARGRYQQVAERAAVTGEDMDAAHKNVDAIEREIASEVKYEIEQELQSDFSALEAKLTALGAKNIRRYEFFSMVYAEVPSEALLESLVSDPAIEMIRSAAGRSEFQIVNSVPGIGAPAFWSAGLRGNGQTVAVLDTGATPDHPAFGGRVLALSNVPFNGFNCLFGDNPFSSRDYVGHGTHVAGIITSQGISSLPNYLGVAPGLSALVSVT